MANTQVRRPSLWKTIAIAAVCAGTLDILDALIFFGLRGVPPLRLLQGIAYGLIGRGSYSGGASSVLLGLLVHFAIATFWAVLYVLLSHRFRLTPRPWLYGTVYGILIYLAMNYIILPLSHIGLRPLPPLPVLINGVAALIVCVGLPIAFITHKLQPDRS